MPQASRYTDQQVEDLLIKLTKVFEEDQIPNDLSLMVLGNMVTNLINSTFSPSQRKMIAQTFSEALLASIREDKAH